MVVILIGVAGAGKTTVGRLLAGDLGWPFLDADDFHPPENVAKMRRGEPLTDEDRGPWLDRLHALLRDRAAGGSLVLACSALREAYRRRLADGVADVRCVFLRGTPGLIARRLAERRGHFMPPALLASQFDLLEVPGDALQVDIDAPPEAIAAAIRNALVAPSARPSSSRPSLLAGGPPGLPAGLDVVRTERLVLTRIVEADFSDLCRMHRDPRVMGTLGGVRSDERSAAVLRLLIGDWEVHGFGYWMARDAVGGAFIGRGGLRHVVVGGAPEVEIGYALMPEYWDRGYATELARACVRVGFEVLGRDDLVAFTLPINERSRRVMERVGFRYEREVIWTNLPHVLYRLRAVDWRGLRR